MCTMYINLNTTQAILAIGAGKADNLNRLLPTIAGNVTLYEADPKLATELQLRYPRAAVINAVVSAQHEKMFFHRFRQYQLNLATNSNKLPPSATNNAALLSSSACTPVLITDVVNKLPESYNGATLLLEAPAQNLSLLSALIAHNQLAQFSQVVVQNLKQHPYFASDNLEDISTLLKTNGFRLICMEETGGILVNAFFEYDSQQAELLLAQNYVRSLEAKLEQQSTLKPAEEEQKLAELTTQLEGKAQQLIAINQELTDAKKFMAQTQDDKAALLDNVELLTLQNKQLANELKEQQRSSQLSIKLLAKVEADAAELRGRYSALQKSEQELRNLVSELYVKLSAASKFYHKLEQEHPELLELK